MPTPPRPETLSPDDEKLAAIQLGRRAERAEILSMVRAMIAKIETESTRDPVDVAARVSAAALLEHACQVIEWRGGRPSTEVPHG